MFRKKKDQKAKAPELFEEDARAAEINPESHHTKTAEPVEEEKPKRREDKIFGNSFTSLQYSSRQMGYSYRCDEQDNGRQN